MNTVQQQYGFSLVKTFEVASLKHYCIYIFDNPPDCYVFVTWFSYWFNSNEFKNRDNLVRNNAKHCQLNICGGMHMYEDVKTLIQDLIQPIHAKCKTVPAKHVFTNILNGNSIAQGSEFPLDQFILFLSYFIHNSKMPLRTFQNFPFKFS